MAFTIPVEDFVKFRVCVRPDPIYGLRVSLTPVDGTVPATQCEVKSGILVHFETVVENNLNTLSIYTTYVPPLGNLGVQQHQDQLNSWSCGYATPSYTPSNTPPSYSTVPPPQPADVAECSNELSIMMYTPHSSDPTPTIAPTPRQPILSMQDPLDFATDRDAETIAYPSPTTTCSSFMSIVVPSQEDDSASSSTESKPKLSSQLTQRPQTKRRRRLQCLFPGCDRKFTSDYTRTVHMNTHKPKPPAHFPCTMGCSEHFSRQHDRLRHEVVKHRRPCWSCPDCKRFFSTEKTLKNHSERCVGWAAPTRWTVPED